MERLKPERRKNINYKVNRNIKRLLREVVVQGTGRQLAKLSFTVYGKQERHNIIEMLGL